MTDKSKNVFEMADGEISVWVDQGQVICMKFHNKWNDPAELSEDEALKLGTLLIRLANELKK